MTPAEYVQLKAFARQDGALLSLLWIGALICYVNGLTNPLMAMTSFLLLVASPIYAITRLRHFRDKVREGVISFLRAYAYMILIFFYAGLLLAVALYIYFAFIDKGYLLEAYTQMFNSEEGQQMLNAWGMEEQMKIGLSQLAAMRPIDYGLNMLTVSIMLGCLIGLPVAAIMQRKVEN